jgi:hypothetical protein
MQTICNVAVCINTQEIIKNKSVLKYTNDTAYFTKQCQDIVETAAVTQTQMEDPVAT